MHDFDYDVKEKKRIARGAAAKKNGSKSKKCTLPSDYLTAKEKKALNGEVKTYCLSKPMSWSEFKAMPLNIQEEYILKLYERFEVSMVDLGYLFGRSGKTIYAYFAEHDICSGLFKRGGNRSSQKRAEQRRQFEKWCVGIVEDNPPRAETEKREVKHTIVNAPKRYVFQPPEPVNADTKPKKAPVITSVGLNFDGPVSAEDLTEKLLDVLKNHADGRDCARFTCRVEFVSNS